MLSLFFATKTTYQTMTAGLDLNICDSLLTAKVWSRCGLVRAALNKAKDAKQKQKKKRLTYLTFSTCFWYFAVGCGILQFPDPAVLRSEDGRTEGRFGTGARHFWTRHFPNGHRHFPDRHDWKSHLQPVVSREFIQLLALKFCLVQYSCCDHNWVTQVTRLIPLCCA